MMLGTIVTVDASNGITCLIDGEDVATTKKYSYLASYVPAANDRVMIEEIGGSYVILGKLCTKVSDSGIARQAEYSEEAAHSSIADTAGSANRATLAEQANTATSASTATNANHATTADTASSATTAQSALTAGSATRASVSSTTDGFSAAFSNTTTGQIITSFTRQYVTSLGTYVVTDINTSSSHSFAYKN